MADFIAVCGSRVFIREEGSKSSSKIVSQMRLMVDENYRFTNKGIGDSGERQRQAMHRRSS
jgi:hypothetical protein